MVRSGSEWTGWEYRGAIGRCRWSGHGGGLERAGVVTFEGGGAGREEVGPGTMVRRRREGPDVGVGRANEGGMGTEVANAGETGTEGEVGATV
jgi:hypothetical protein